MERRRPTRRLKRVDLPTLGRPTRAMMGRIMACSPARSAAEQGGDEGPGRRLHGAHGNAEAAAHVLEGEVDRKSTRLNSSHLGISYAVFCLKTKTHPTTH